MDNVIDNVTNMSVTTLPNIIFSEPMLSEVFVRCFAMFVLVSAAYLFTTVIVYQIRNVAQQPNRTPMQRGSRRTLRRTLSSISYVSRHSTILAKLHFLVALSVLLRCIHETIHAFIDPYSDFYCIIYLRAHIFFYGLAIASVYIFLWARQRIFYDKPILRASIPACVRKISVLVMVMMVLTETATIVIFFLTRNYRVHNGQCVVEPSDEIYEYVPWVVLAMSSITFQLLLMVLFVYPLVNHCEMMRKSNQKDNQDFPLLIKRVAIAAGVCVASDIFALLVTFFTRSIRMSNFIYDVNLVVDLLCVTCSYFEWKQMIFSCYRKHDR